MLIMSYDVLWYIFTQCAMLRFYHRWKIGIRPKMSSEDTFHFHTFCSPWASPFFEKDKRRKSKSIEEQFSGCWRFWEFKRTTTFSLITIYCGRTELINDVRKSFSNDDLWTEIWRWWSFLLQAKKGSRSKWAFLFYHACITLFKKYSKFDFNFWRFRLIFVLLKVTCLVTLFDRKLQNFKNSLKLNATFFCDLQTLTFDIFNELLSIQNVYVARFARNVEWDFFCDFQTPCLCLKVKMCSVRDSSKY